MAKYHINPDGNAGQCKASQGNCPFGPAEEHYDSPEAAREAYEQNQGDLAASPQTFSKKKLVDLGVDDELAEKIIDSGFRLTPKSFYESLKEMPVYKGVKPEINERIKIVRNTYSEDGALENSVTHVGKLVAVEERDGLSGGRGTLAIVIDSEPFTEDDLAYETSAYLERKVADSSGGHWMRLRNEGPIIFNSGRSAFIEHDVIERIGPADETLDDKNKAIREANRTAIRAKMKEEARARRPWPFNRA